jgi:hypothetical protein
MCRTILHGTDGFTIPPKEVVLRTLSPLKIHRSRPGLDPRTLGHMAITITITPSRMTIALTNSSCHNVIKAADTVKLSNCAKDTTLSTISLDFQNNTGLNMQAYD